MKLSILVMTTLITFQAGISASAASSDSQGSVTGLCLECMKRDLITIKNLDQMRAISKRVQIPPGRETALRTKIANSGLGKITDVAEEATKLIDSTEMGKAPMCSKFIDNGELKEYGKIIAKAFNYKEAGTSGTADGGQYQNLYNGSKDMQMLCPNYSKLDADQRITLWAMVVGQWSFLESSCNPNATLGQARKGKWGAPNGVAAGLFQTHQGNESLYSRRCKNGDSKNPDRAIRCVFAVQDETIAEGNYFFGLNAQWAVLKPQTKEIPAKTSVPKPQHIMKQICQFSACGATSETCNKAIRQLVAEGKAYDANRRAERGAAKKRVAVAR